MHKDTKSPTVLGRGLGTLFNKNINFKNENNISEIPIIKIQPNPMQPRKHFDDLELEQLAMSIQQNGIIQPITVRKIDHDFYQLISGERRLKACKRIKWQTIPAYIRIAEDEKLLEIALIENIQRTNLNPIEIALSYKRLVEECGYNQEIIADRVGKKRSTISNFLRLLKLPPIIQLALKEKKISIGHAKALINLDTIEQQAKFLKQILIKGFSVRKVEELVQNFKKPKKQSKPINQNLNEYIENVCCDLQSKFGANINIKVDKVNDENKNTSFIGKGKIVINFNSKKQLDELLGLMRNIH